MQIKELLFGDGRFFIHEADRVSEICEGAPVSLSNTQVQWAFAAQHCNKQATHLCCW